MGKKVGFMCVALGLTLCSYACDSGSSKKPSCRGAGCDAGMDAGDAREAGPPDDGGTAATLQGRVFDAESAAALSGAELVLSTAMTSSDKDGAFSLKAPEKADARVLEVVNEGYVPSKRFAPTKGGYLEVFLKKVDERISFRGDQGVSVRLPSGAGIDIPAGAVEDRQGVRIDGEVTLEFAEVDGRVRSQAASLPGDGHGRTLDQQAGLVSIARALSIRILDDKESELTVNQVAKVVALMPSGRSDAPFSERAYSYDEATNEWVEESTASQVTRDGVRSYRVEIEHLSWWAVGRFFEATTCIRACVENPDGEKVDGAQVWVVGATHAGVSTFFTDAMGCGSSDVIADAEVVLVAQYLDAVSDASKVGTGSALVAVGSDGSACKDVGTLRLKGNTTKTCPLGLSACGTACVDLSSDTKHCGACGNVCGTGELCVVDTCVAPVPSTISVRGKVVDRYGSPWPNIPVRVGDTTVNTDATGTFAFDDVTVPYDLRVDRGEPAIYLGVTRPDPVVYNGIQSGNVSTIRGTVTGANIPLPTNYEMNVSFVGPTSINFNAIRRAGDDGNWGELTRTLRWSPALGPLLMGGIFAIQHDEVSADVTGMAFKEFSIASGQLITYPELDMVLSPVTLHAVDFEVVVPAGMTFTTYDLSLGLYSQNLATPPLTFSLKVPDELPPQVPARFIARGNLGTDNVSLVRYFDATARSLRVQLPVPATCVEPPDGAMVSRTASLEFAPSAGSVTALNLTWVQATDGTGAVVFTQATSVSFEQMSALGVVPVPDDGVLTWSPQGNGPAGDVDELLAPGQPPFPDTIATSTSPRKVTFAP